MKRICYLFKSGRRERIASQDTFPVEFFYGYFYFKEKGYQVEIIEEGDILKNIKPFAPQLMYKLFEKVLSLFEINLQLLLCLSKKELIKKINSFDVLVATTNSFGLITSCLRRCGLIKTKIVFIVMGIVEANTNFLKRLFYGFLFKDVILCSLGEKEAERLTKSFFLFKPKIFYIPFGTDTVFWIPHLDKQIHSQTPYFISIGNDRHRDYETLINSWQSHVPLLKIITQHKIVTEKATISENIEILSGRWDKSNFSDSDIRDLIQKSMGVIVPLKETVQPSGQSVSLQAMACAKPLILTETSGIWSRMYLKHKFNCYLIKPRNIQDLKTAVKWIIDNKDAARAMGIQARETVLKHFTVAHFNEKLYSILIDNYV